MFSLADKHNFTVMAGYQEENYAYSYLYESVTDMISTNNPGLNLGTGEKSTTDTRDVYKRQPQAYCFGDVPSVLESDLILSLTK